MIALANDENRLIADLSLEYAERMCEGRTTPVFTRCDIAAAYQIGAIATLHRLRGIIRQSAAVGGLQDHQALTLLRIINRIESMPSSNESQYDNAHPDTTDSI